MNQFACLSQWTVGSIFSKFPHYVLSVVRVQQSQEENNRFQLGYKDKARVKQKQFYLSISNKITQF